MKIYLITVLIVLINSGLARALSMADLFAALQSHPTSQIDLLQTETAELGAQRVYDRFYPALTGIISYQEFNSPTNLRPVTPTESAERLSHDEPLPFSDNISRIGAQVTMPIFIKELFTLGKKASMLTESSRTKQQLNLLQREAVLISTNSELKHIEQLQQALLSRKASLEKTREDIHLQVKEGRAPNIELVRMDEAINKIDISCNETDQVEAQLQKTIEELTGIYIENALPMEKVRELNEGPFFALQPLEKSIQASEYAVQAARDKLYPWVVASGEWFNNSGEGYNNGENIDLEYGNFTIALQIPLFFKPYYTDIALANIELRQEKMHYQKTQIELAARERNLKQNLKLLASSLELGRKSVEHERELLRVAKISFQQRRMLQEEYLRYEESLLQAQANYYGTQARWWQNFSTLAVLYGNNLHELVK